MNEEEEEGRKNVSKTVKYLEAEKNDETESFEKRSLKQTC